MVSFDDILLADAVDPGITVVAQDPRALGRAAAELLFSRLDGDDGPTPAHRAADRADRARLGRARAERALTDGVRTGCLLLLERSRTVCKGLQNGGHPMSLANVCQVAVGCRAWPSAAAPRRRSPTSPPRPASRRRPRPARSPRARSSTRTRGGACGRSRERLRFQPNRLARSLRAGATMAVGLVVPDVGAAFYASALKGAQDALEAAGYHVLVLNTGRAAAREREALRTLRSHQVDGLLVATSGRLRGHRRARRLLRQRPGAARRRRRGDGQRRRHAAAGRAPRRRHGHRRIAYIGPPETVGTGADACCRARAASGWRPSGRRSGAPGWRCRRSTCAPASRRASRRTRASRRAS